MNPEAPEFTIHSLRRGTARSAGLDLAAGSDYILSSLEGPTVVDTKVLGSLPGGMMGLILGRSSNIGKGIEVIPGVLDADTKDTIKVIIKATKETVIIRQGQRIAQVILLPYVNLPNQVLMEKRQGQLGSTDLIALTQEIGHERPIVEVSLNGKRFKGILDTGSDKTCIAGKDWPRAWPVTRTSSSLVGLGMAANVARSTSILTWTFEDQTGHVQPYVIPSLPFFLWGRDMMEGMGLMLTTVPPLLEDQYFS